jgi:hypothetical protein
MNHLGIVDGLGNQRFEPEHPVTRQEFAKIFAGTLGLNTSEAPNRHYEDVSPELWSKPYIDALTNAGLVEGEEKDGKWYFHPESSITRAEAATMIGRTELFRDIPIYGDEVTFADFHDVPKWAEFSVIRLADAAWINGYPNGTFRPWKTLSRAEAAKLISKFLGL